MRIDSPNLVGATVITGSAVVTGSVVPGSDLLYDFGSSLKRWGNVYAVNLRGSFTGSNVTVGQVIVAGTGGVLSGTNNLFWDNTSTRLGIGTSSLTSTLTVSGSATATIPVLTLRQGAVTPGAASLDVQNRLGASTFWVSGSGTSFFSGSVGIGTSVFSAALFVSGGTAASNSTVVIREGVVNALSNAEVLDVQRSSGSSLFWVSGSGDSYFSGSVGIGATQPAGKLDVSGVSGSLLLITDTMSGSLFSVNNVSGLPIFEVFSDNTVVAGGYGTNSLVVTGSNVGIGATTPAGKLDVTGVSGSLLLVTDVMSGSLFSVNNVSGLPILEVFSDDTLIAGGYNTNALVVSGSRVGIGSFATADRLSVSGSMSVTGSLEPGVSNTHSLGSSTKLWSTVFATAFSGSLTRLSNGSDYLVAGPNITLTTGSNGAITITGTSSGTVAGTGTANLVARWTASTTLGTGVLYDTGTNVGIGTASPGERLEVAGVIKAVSSTFGIVSTLSNGSVSLREAAGSSANNIVEAHIRPSSGKSGYISFTEDQIADRWSIGIQNGNSSLRFLSGYPTTGTERMTLTSGGNLGIGTNNPIFRLQLGSNTGASTSSPETINMGGTYSSTAGSNIKLRLYNDATNATGISVSANQLEYIGHTGVSHVWFSGGSEIARITSGGKVGIGHTNPYAPLHVKSLISNAYGESIVIDPGAATPTYGTIAFRLEGAQGSNFTGTWVFGKAASNTGPGEAFVFGKHGLTGGSLYSDPTLTSVIKTNGDTVFGFNVGIGTTNPGYKLTIAGGPPGGQAVFAIDNTAYFVAKNAAGTYEDYFWPRWSDNIMYLNYGSSGWNIRNNSSTTTMFMTNGGNVGIGTTNPLFRLQLGNQTSTSTATPETISLGGTFSSTAGANPKLRLWTDGSTMYGLGVSTGQLDYIGSGGSHVWYLAGTEITRINSSGMSVTGSILPGQDVTYALGSETKRWQHIYTGDLHLKNERGDWTIIEEEDCLTMRNNKTGKRYKINMTPMPELDEPLGSFSTGPKPSP